MMATPHEHRASSPSFHLPQDNYEDIANMVLWPSTYGIRRPQEFLCLDLTLDLPFCREPRLVLAIN